MVLLPVAATGVLLAGVSKGGFASGASFVATPLVAMVLPPAQALGLLLPLLMVIDAATLRPYWRKWDSDEVLRLLLGAAPGILLAGAVYRMTDPDVLRVLIGSIALAYGGQQIWRRMRGSGRGRRLPSWAGPIAGGVAGFTSFVSHAGGPPVAVYLLSRHLPKLRLQATTVVVFTTINLLKAASYLALGLFAPVPWTLVASLVPVALAGAWLGVHAHGRVSEPLFLGITYVLLVAAGTRLVWVGLT